MLQTLKLDNGISVVTYNIPGLRSFHLGINVKGGSLGEPKEKSGIAHFMEHMLVQGIPSYKNAEELSSFVESIAGSYRATTSFLTVAFSIFVPISHLEDAVQIASEVFFKPLFPEEALEKERHAVINEIKQDEDAKTFKINQFFKNVRYTKESPLKLRVGGTMETVQKLTREDLVQYWTTHFLPENTYISIIGSFKDEELQTILTKYFGGVKSSQQFQGYPELSNSKDLSTYKVALRTDKELKVNYLDLTFPSLPLDTDLLTRIKQNIAFIILGNLRSSRLFKLLRYQKGLVYGVSTGDAAFPGTGYGYVSSEVASEHLDEVLTLIVQTLSEYMKNGPISEEVEVTKNYLSNNWLMAFDNPSSISSWIKGELLWRDKIRLPEEYIELIKDITPKDLVKVMQTYWDMKNLNLIIQGPITDSKEQVEKYTEMVKDLK